MCDECREKAEVEKKAKQARNRRFSELSSTAVKYFRDHYLDQWKSLFKNAKYKKDIWTITSNANIESRSLSQFYTHYKSMDSYVDSLVSLVHIPNIIAILDIELEQLLVEPLRLNKEIESVRLAEAYFYYKGR